jgi:hypothetical protein
VFDRGLRSRCATILLMFVCAAGYADSINSFSDKSPRLPTPVQLPLHQYSARLTGVSPFWSSSLSNNSRPLIVPIHFLIPEEESRPVHTSSSFDRTIDLLVYLYRNVVMGKQRKPRHPEACKKGAPEDHCSSTDGK